MLFFTTTFMSLLIDRLVWSVPIDILNQLDIVASSTTLVLNGTSTPVPTATVLQIPSLPPAQTAPPLPAPGTNESRPLLVLPLGDSITFGLGTDDRNSYREALQTRLSQDAFNISFVGSVSSGSMLNNKCEGHAGATIDQIAAFAEQFMGTILAVRSSPSSNNTLDDEDGRFPSVVTLVAGTNDVAQNLDIANAPGRVLSLTNTIHAISPNTTVLVGGIPPLALGNRQAAVDSYNSALEDIIQSNAAAGRRMGWVNMTALTVADLADGVHPNAGGYLKMSDAWVAGMVEAIGKGLIIP